MRFPKCLAFVAVLTSSVAALSSVTRGGRYLYTQDGTRFYIKGVAYQPQGTLQNPNFPEPTDFTDPLADSAGCQRDIPFLQQLGVNTIRVYSVNNALNHDSCMQALSSAGIYTIIDLSLPLNGSIDRTTPSWTTNLQDLYLETASVFLKYDNILAFNIGNEIVAQPDQIPNVTAAAPFIKAAARDVKAFLKSKNSNVLVGYASTDGDPSWRDPLAHYMGCNSEQTSIDLFGLNNYEWCGNSNFDASYAGTNLDFSDLSYPAYFSEFGCDTSPPRLFTEVQALFGPQMTPIWSGGLAFSYFPTGNFGLVNITSDNKTVTPNDDFNRLKAQYSNVTFSNSPSQSDAGQTQYPSCPTPNSTFVASSSLPPTPDTDACTCVDHNAVSCVFVPPADSETEPAIAGTLLGQGCGDLANNGGNCDVIAANGATGTYGPLAMCSPAVKLDYVFTAFYETTNRNAQSCNFAGNATVIQGAQPSAALASAASSCLAQASATFTPTAPAVPSSSHSGSSGSGGSGHSGSTTLQIFGQTRGLLGLSIATSIAIFVGIWTLSWN